MKRLQIEVCDTMSMSSGLSEVKDVIKNKYIKKKLKASFSIAYTGSHTSL